MARKSCPGCAKGIKKEFNYCPFCGISLKEIAEQENFGLLGRDDYSPKLPIRDEQKIPFGLGKIVDSLARQLEKQMGSVNFENLFNGMNNSGFKIKISTTAETQEEEEQPVQKKISKEEIKRRIKLPRVDANSRFRRLSDKIVYELEVPGVNSLENVEIKELESGFEIKAYSKKECFVKFIQLKSEIKNFYIEGGKLFVELKA